jgi:hypothetical protein
VPKEVREAYKVYTSDHKHKKIRYIAQMNAAINSAKPRFFIYDLVEKTLESCKVSHGIGGKNRYPHDGYAREFSNVPGSNMTSLGAYLCAETYIGGNGLSLRLDGLEKTNSNARSRLIVIHGANYVNESNNKKQGRSQGCPAMDHDVSSYFINKLKNGSVFVITHD